MPYQMSCEMPKNIDPLTGNVIIFTFDIHNNVLDKCLFKCNMSTLPVILISAFLP